LDFPKICTVALVNPPETAACLFVAVDLRNQGQGIAAVELAIESKSLAENAGVSEKRKLEVGQEPKLTEIRVNIQRNDLGQTHDVTFMADPQKAIEETDEDNNSITVKLSLPAMETLPASAVCPPETTATPQAGGSTTPAPSTETGAATETAAAGS
jgi:hypothetical protein